MRWVLIALVFFSLVGIFFIRRRNSSLPEVSDSLPYALGDAMFTPAERSFLGVLDQVVGSDFRVFGKVRVADVVAVARGTPYPLWQKAFNQISAKHFDFVLCRPKDLKPICAIELNDQSHEKVIRQGRDKFLERVCSAAGIPLIFIPAKRSYRLDDISVAIAGVMAANLELIDVTAPGLVGDINALTIDEQFDSFRKIDKGPGCPRCASPMYRRVAKSGKNAGKKFWGCTKFPRCLGTVVS